MKEKPPTSKAPEKGEGQAILMNPSSKSGGRSGGFETLNFSLALTATTAAQASSELDQENDWRATEEWQHTENKAADSGERSNNASSQNCTGGESTSIQGSLSIFRGLKPGPRLGFYAAGHFPFTKAPSFPTGLTVGVKTPNMTGTPCFPAFSSQPPTDWIAQA